MRLWLTVFAFLSITSTSFAVESDPYTAHRDNDGFFVNNGDVYYVNGSGESSLVVSPFLTFTSILMFKNKLIGLTASGGIYLLTEYAGPGKGTWEYLHGSTLKIATDGKNLYALANRTTWAGLGKTETDVKVLYGGPDDLQINIGQYLYYVPCGSNPLCIPMYTYFVTMNGRSLNFESANAPDAVDLVSKNGQMNAITKSGKTIELSK